MSPNAHVKEIIVKMEVRPDMANSIKIVAIIKDTDGLLWVWPKDGVLVDEEARKQGLSVFLHSLAKHLDKK